MSIEIMTGIDIFGVGFCGPFLYNAIDCEILHKQLLIVRSEP